MKHPRLQIVRTLGFALVFFLSGAQPNQAAEKIYAVVISEASYGDQAWRVVADTLVTNHHGHLIRFKRTVDESLAGLRALQPDYIGFVARPEESGRGFVEQVHRLTRQIDDDPYGDALWGILTGHDAGDALRMAQCTQPMMIRRAASSMGPGQFDELAGGFASSETNRTEFWTKVDGGKTVNEKVSPDPVASLVRGFNTMMPDLFVTSGHASEKDWQIGYTAPAGQFVCSDGQLFGVNIQGEKFPIHSPNPKVYVAAGNCLIGHITGTDCMATAWLHSGGVNQMVGYTVPTWFGYMGWGTLGLFGSGRYTLAEAFFFNNQALLHRILSGGPLTNEEREGFPFERDRVAFYGDPAWEVRLPMKDPGWQSSFARHDNRWTFSLVTNRDGDWPDRPVMAFLPERLTRPKILAGKECKPVLTRRFILVPLSGKFKKGQRIEVEFGDGGVPSAADARQEALDFLTTNMPDTDRGVVSKTMLEEQVDYSMRAMQKAPWGAGIPHDLFLNEILPYANVDEARDEWRKDFFERFSERAWKCGTPGEAALLLNRQLFNELNVRYHATKRPRPNQSPHESISAGYASCTGLSILLVDACRACGIPARLAGIPEWADGKGNHTWAEVWDNGIWHYIGAAEDQQFDHAWFSEKVRGKGVDPNDPIHRVYAVSFRKTGLCFPLPWNPENDRVHAEDVTANYHPTDD